MIEPPETESREKLDDFIVALKEIAECALENPDLVKDAPHHTVVRRLDEVKAARTPLLLLRTRRFHGNQGKTFPKGKKVRL